MIGISSPTLSLIDFGKALNKVAMHFKHWEIIGEYKHFLPEIKDEFAELKESYGLGYSIHAPLSDINIASVIPPLRKFFLKQIIDTIKACANLDISLLTLHPGHYSALGWILPERVKKANRRSLVELKKVANDYNVTLALENMPKNPITICYAYKDFMEALEGTGIKICLDVGHAYTCNQLEEFLNVPNIANVHLHDNHGNRDEHLELGKGEINFKWVVDNLKPQRLWVVETKSLEAGIKSKEKLKNLLS